MRFVVFLSSFIWIACSSEQADTQQQNYQTGFMTDWILDESRNQTLGDLSLEARPILVNIWYPTNEPATDGQNHTLYFDLESDDRIDPSYISAFITYHRDTALQTSSGYFPEDIPADPVMTRPIAIKRDAVPADGLFPVIIAHSGAGSSYDDNAMSYEWLAQQGYVVISSAYQRTDLEDRFSVDGGEDSFSDIKALIDYAGQLSFADNNRLAYMGHSLGAQAILRAAAGGHGDPGVIIALDTTQDYYPLSDPRWMNMVQDIKSVQETYEIPTLFAADNRSIFLLPSLMSQADRLLVLPNQLDHDQYISQGVIAAQYGEAENHSIITEEYWALMSYVERFLDEQLRGDETVTSDWAGEGLRSDPIFAIRINQSEFVHERYQVVGFRNSPPSLFELNQSEGPEAVIEILRDLKETRPEHPALSSGFGYSLIYDLAETGRVEEAQRLDQAYQDMDMDVFQIFTFFAPALKQFGREEYAIPIAEIGLLVRPDNAELQAVLDD